MSIIIVYKPIPFKLVRNLKIQISGSKMADEYWLLFIYEFILNGDNYSFRWSWCWILCWYVRIWNIAIKLMDFQDTPPSNKLVGFSLANFKLLIEGLNWCRQVCNSERVVLLHIKRKKEKLYMKTIVFSKIFSNVWYPEEPLFFF